MIKGLYTAASGMLPQIRKQEVISNNLANAATPGFKREGIFLRELSRAQEKTYPKVESWEKPMFNDIYTDYSQSVLSRTDNPLNLALDGKGFFTVQSDSGENLYTRAGSFTISPEGQLVNPNGQALLTDAGPIEVEAGADIAVSVEGYVSVGGEDRGKLALANFEDPQKLEHLDGGVYRAPADATQVDPESLWIRQGFLEEANVDVVREMVDMIQSFREFESNQKIIHIADETLSKTVNEVGAKR